MPQLESLDLKSIKAIVFDVDGVLTDGRIVYDNAGNETKFFHARDGMGVRLAREAGLFVGILTARSSPCVSLRIKELKFHLYRHGVKDKGSGIEEMASTWKISPEEIAYMGDDLPDLAAMKKCGFAITVQDASSTVLEYAAHVTQKPGGHGAVREAVEFLLKGQGKWESVIGNYLPSD